MDFSQPVVACCGTGVTACVLALAMHQLEPDHQVGMGTENEELWKWGLYGGQKTQRSHMCVGLACDSGGAIAIDNQRQEHCFFPAVD